MGIAYRNELAQVATTDTAIYTCPASRQAVINNAVLTNTSSNDVTVNIHLYESGGSPSVSNLIVKDQLVLPGAEVILNPLISMGIQTGGVVSAIADVNNEVNFRLGIMETF